MFALPLAINMEAIWAVTLQALYSIINEKKKVWRAYFMCFHAPKDSGFNFRRNYTLTEYSCLSLESTRVPQPSESTHVPPAFRVLTFLQPSEYSCSSAFREYSCTSTLDSREYSCCQCPDRLLSAPPPHTCCVQCPGTQGPGSHKALPPPRDHRTSRSQTSIWYDPPPPTPSQ